MNLSFWAQVQRQKGASLLEVMISLFVLGIGILGVLVMQVQSLRINGQAYNYSKAVFLANDILERMRNNLNGLDAYVVDRLSIDEQGIMQNGSACYGSAANDCTPAALASADLQQWAKSLTESLPGVSASISKQNTDNAQINDANGNVLYDGNLYKIEINFSPVQIGDVTIGDSEGNNEPPQDSYVLITGV